MNTTTATERPILFSAPMVRGILAGTKAQTRRIWKMPPGMGWYVSGALKGEETGDVCDLTGPGWCSVDEVRCPYGRPGDRLWVRETWGYFGGDEYLYQKDLGSVGYRASQFDGIDHVPGGRWRPSIHMPRWASRITLEVTGVRVERLQDISIADAMAEGVVECNPSLRGLGPCSEWRYAYEDLWKQINGQGAWESNPWVWVVEFKRI